MQRRSTHKRSETRRYQKHLHVIRAAHGEWVVLIHEVYQPTAGDVSAKDLAELDLSWFVISYIHILTTTQETFSANIWMLFSPSGATSLLQTRIHGEPLDCMILTI